MLRRTRPGRETGATSKGGKRGASDAPAPNLERLDTEIAHWVTDDRPLIGEVLLEAGVIDADQLTNALVAQKEQGGRLGELLGIDEHTLASTLAQQFRIRLADLRGEHAQREALDRVGEDLARKHRVLPHHIDDEDRTWIVTADPLNADAIRELTQQCGKVGVLIGVASDIERLLDQEYNVLNQASVYIQAMELTEREVAEDDIDLKKVDENAPIVQVVNRIITQGVRVGASDVHIESQESGIRVRYRVDGALSEAIQLPAKMGGAISSRIKVMAELNIVERRRPQDGQFSVTVDNRPIDIRTSVVATVHGEKIVLRLLDKQRSLISLRDLGMPEELVKRYNKIVKAPLGMILVTGPTGSGKTTTLYATLNEINDPSKNVVTIEDPVEYQFDGINQMQVSEAAGITFADGLRGILRQDPDTILVGEIRDIETAGIAMQAALTGHLVLSSLHAVDAVAALHRFTDMGLETFLVASAVSGVIGQRLLRRNCPACTVPHRPPSEHVRLVAAQLGTGAANFMKGPGCTLCNGTGYQGRVGVYELLTVTDAIRQMIVDKATHADMLKVAVKEGMRTMQVEAFQLVADGVTTVEEVMRSVYAPGVDLEISAAGELMPGKKEIEAGAAGLPSGDEQGDSGGSSGPGDWGLQVVEGGA